MKKISRHIEIDQYLYDQLKIQAKKNNRLVTEEIHTALKTYVLLRELSESLDK